MKKKKFGIIGVIVLVVLLIISSSITTDNKNSLSDDLETIISNATNEAKSIKSSEMKSFNEINVDEYINKYNGEEKSLVLIGRDTCHYCQIANPILKHINYIYKIEFNYLNTDNFKEGDAQKLIDSDSYFANGFGTPLLLVIQDGSIKDKVDGLTDTAHYMKFLKENGFIK